MYIDDATPTDVDDIADQWVRLAAGQRAYGSHLRADDNRAVVRERIAASVVANMLLVAREGSPDGDTGAEAGKSDLLGFAMLDVETGEFEQDVDRGIVANLYVVPGARGRGVGSALLEAAERRLADRGADTVAIEVMAENEDARRLYRNHGYEPHRLEMEKPLDDGPAEHVDSGGDAGRLESDSKED